MSGAETSPYRTLAELIENTTMLSQGVPLGEEMLASIAISLKRLADLQEARASQDNDARQTVGGDRLKPEMDSELAAYNPAPEINQFNAGQPEGRRLSTLHTARSLLRCLPASATAVKIDEILAAVLAGTES